MAMFGHALRRRTALAVAPADDHLAPERSQIKRRKPSSILVQHRAGDGKRASEGGLWRLTSVGSNTPLDQCASAKHASKEAPPIIVSSNDIARWTPAGPQQSLDNQRILGAACRQFIFRPRAHIDE